jgi:potassium efflux system protein
MAVLFAVGAQAQSPPPDAPTVAAIEARIADLESDGIDASTREAALEQYRRALDDVRAAAAFETQAREFELARVEAPQQEATLRARLAAGAPAEPVGLLEGGESTAEIEQRLNVERAQLVAAEQTLAQIGQQLDALRDRPAEARARLSEASQEQRALSTAMETAAPAEADPVGEARRAADRARLRALDAEIRMLELDLLSQPARLSLREVRQQEAAADVERLRDRVQRLRTLLAERRRGEAERVVAESDAAKVLEATESEAVRSLVETNVALAEELAALGESARRVAEEQQDAGSELDSLRRRFESARQKLDVAGLSPALGRFLQAEQRDLPGPAEFGQSSRARGARIAAAGLRAIQLDENLERWRQTDRRVGELVDSVADEVDDTLREGIESLVGARVDLLRRLLRVNSDYLRTLSELEYTDQQIRQVVAEYRDFLSRNLLWVRNETVLGPAKLMRLPGEVAALFEPGRWLAAARALAAGSLSSPLQMLAWLLLLLGIWGGSRGRRLLRETARRVGKPSEDRMSFTLQAVGLTLMLAAPWPLFTLLTGHQLGVGGHATAASAAVGNALVQISPLLFFLTAFRGVCVRGGLAEAHFRWSSEGVAALRRELALLAATLLLPGFLMLVATRFVVLDESSAFVQLTFLVLVAGLVRFLYKLLRPAHGIVERLRRRPGQRPVLRWPWFWMVVALAIPVFLGVAAVAGFLYSAGMLLDRLITTLLLLLALVVLRELVVRWLLVMRRRLLLREALARREAARQADAAGAPGDGAAASGAAGIGGEPGSDVASLDADSRKLVNVALAVGGLLSLGTIWAPVLPALGMLETVTLWQYAETAGDVETLARVTLTDLLLALFVVLLTVAAARSLPALVEIFLRQRRAVPSGSRLAFATLTRYGLVLIGLGVALSTVGINWSKLQWLVAALGVGIGFGLQEIVANFISGLIILIERPVRVGDVVTVGDASGTVSRIRIRATTIRNWDEQELIVPNKEFITARVVNWSLSDEITRIFFQVGVAYGSDTKKALELIREAAAEHPAVLDEPPPLVTFESFGDNSLNLGLRCYVSSIGDRLETRTDLHLAIDRKMREAGIVIAFPQRDVHLDTAGPLEVRMVDRPEGGAG